MAKLLEWRPWLAGSVAGTSLTVIGHPFDTVKTRIQTDPSHRSSLHCASSIARNEGSFALWKGLQPAVVAGAVVMVVVVVA